LAVLVSLYAEDSARFTGDRDLNLVRDLNPDLQSFETWLTKHKNELKTVVN
jgi:hypothetical protein